MLTPISWRLLVVMAKGFSSFKKIPIEAALPSPPPSGLMAVVPVSKIRIWEEKSPPSTLMISREEDERGDARPCSRPWKSPGTHWGWFLSGLSPPRMVGTVPPTIKAQRGDETSLSRAGTPLSRGLAEPCRYAYVPASLSRADATDLNELPASAKRAGTWSDLQVRHGVPATPVGSRLARGRELQFLGSKKQQGWSKHNSTNKDIKKT